MKMTDSPGAMDVMPFSATEFANRFESSSIRQPEISTAAGPVFVTSNQSAMSGLLPLDQGATSEITSGLAAAAGRGRRKADAASEMTTARRMQNLACVSRARTRSEPDKRMPPSDDAARGFKPSDSTGSRRLGGRLESASDVNEWREKNACTHRTHVLS